MSEGRSYYPEPLGPSGSLEDYSSSYESRLKHQIAETYGLPQFPKVLTIQKSVYHFHSYCRSLLLAKHGFPLWYTQEGLSGRTKEYIKKGTCVGDVGCIGDTGSFKFFFNIFLAADDPIHAFSVPEVFTPLEIDPSDIISTPDYFKPGTIITSDGVKISKRRTDPLAATFTSREREGAMLVLPSGASRNDMVLSDRLYEYIRRNTPYWYQYALSRYGPIYGPISNGSIVVVTGCDKALEYGNASFHFASGSQQSPIKLEYTWRPNFERPWWYYGYGAELQYRWYQPPHNSTPPIPDTKSQCIFVRTMPLSLSGLTWMETLSTRQLPPTSLILEKRSLIQRFIHFIAVLRGLKHSEDFILNHGRSMPPLFHPNMSLAPILMHQHPHAEIALIDDSMWCAQARGGLCTLSNISRLVDDVLDNCKVVVVNGALRLEPTEKQFSISRRIRRNVKRLWTLPRHDITYIGDYDAK